MDRLVLMVVIAFTTNLIAHRVDYANAESVSYKPVVIEDKLESISAAKPVKLTQQRYQNPRGQPVTNQKQQQQSQKQRPKPSQNFQRPTVFTILGFPIPALGDLVQSISNVGRRPQIQKEAQKPEVYVN